MKFFKYFIVLFVLGTLLQEVDAQYRSKYFYVGVALGATNYKGDLDDNFSLKFTRPGLGIVGGYKFHPHMSVRLGFNQGWIGATDNRAARDIPRQRRNLSFRSPITEGALTLQYEFFANTRQYKFRPQYTPYVYGGIAVFNFRPQAKLGHAWYELQPLGTEGQYLPDPEDQYPEAYSLTQISIPMGVGVRYRLTKRLDLNVEIGLRKTFTDYLDDVGGDYANPNDLIDQVGPLSAIMANRTLEGVNARNGQSRQAELDQFLNNVNPQTFDQAGRPTIVGYGNLGDKRGQSNNYDVYFFTAFHLNYIVNVGLKCPSFR